MKTSQEEEYLEKLMQKDNRQILAKNDLEIEALIAKGYTEASKERDTVQYSKHKKDNRKMEGNIDG